ncbi:ABC transporter substrate-binding protein [Acetobacterium carbinolicum]|uniref:ABC transporter substrate-binding protein n=1 Tax=Acetobacterium carbinolicum TaxID=52690 RepID=UPI0039C91D40
MKKLLGLLMVAVLMVSVLSGCSQSTAKEETEPEKSGVVTDELGREVTIPENPQRILCLVSSAMNTVYNLGLEPIGKVEEYKITEAGMALPSVGQSQTINMEAVYELKPDLIIASSRFHAAQQEELEKSGAVVYFFDPDAVGDIPVVDITAYLGKVLNREAEGEAYVQKVMDDAAVIAEKVAATGLTTGIMLQTGDTVMAAQTATSYGSMLTLMGLENVVPENLPNAKKSSFVVFDVEAIATANPDVIYLVAQSNDQEANKQMKQSFMEDQKWAELSAVKNKNVVVLPFKANPNRATPEEMLTLTANALLEKAQ